MNYANLYDELYANNPAFRDYVNNAQVVENNGVKKTIHESISESEPTLKEKVLTFFVNQDSKNMEFLENFSEKGKKIMVFLIFGVVIFVIIKFNLFKDIKAFLRSW